MLYYDILFANNSHINMIRASCVAHEHISFKKKCNGNKRLKMSNHPLQFH